MAIAKVHEILPAEVTGYALDPENSWWAVVLPEASVNLVVNPSFEYWTVTEYTAADWSASSYEEHGTPMATAGRRLAKLTTAAAQATLTYDAGIAVAAGPYTFSCDVYMPALGSVVTLQILNSPTVLASRSYTARRIGWHRLHVSHVEAASGTRQLRLLSPASNASGLVFYTDCWQFEAKPYPTTYFDGDSISIDDQQFNQSFYWQGAPHQSPSVRRANSAGGGREVSWSEDVDFLTTSITGLGMAPITHFTDVLADGREVSRGATGAARPFTITGRIFGCSYDNLIDRCNDLIRLLRPNNTDGGQQMLLRYQYIASTPEGDGEELEIACTYTGGLEGSINNLYQTTLAIQFRASQPYLSAIVGSNAELELYKELVTNNVIFKDEEGDYVNLGEGDTDAFPTRVGFLRNGSPVAFGPFSELAGDLVDDSAYWDGANWQQLGDLAGRSASYVIDGYESGYPLTIATTIGDVVEYDEDTDTWADLGNGFTGAIYAIDRDPAGNIWVAGEFEQDEDMLITYNNVAKWNVLTEAWETLGDGLTDPDILNPILRATTVLADDDGYVYFGGWFERGDSGAATTLANGAIRWNPATSEWSAMGYGFNAAPNQFIRGHNGYIYAVGEFDQDGTESYDLRGFARWNGYQWEEVFELVRQDGTFGADGIAIDENGIFWFFAYVTDPDQDLFVVPTLGEVGTFGWKDGVFYPSIGSVSITHMAIGPGNRTIYAVRAIDLEATYKVPALNRIEYTGTADSFVALHVQGKCTPVHAVNLDTQGGVYFRADFVVGANEEAVVRSDVQRTLAYSPYRPNLKRFISTGATNLRALRLRPGENRVSVFAHNIETLDAAAWLTWRNKYWGIV